MPRLHALGHTKKIVRFKGKITLAVGSAIFSGNTLTIWWIDVQNTLPISLTILLIGVQNTLLISIVTQPEVDNNLITGGRRFMAEILSIWRKTLSINQLIN